MSMIQTIAAIGLLLLSIGYLILKIATPWFKKPKNCDSDCKC
jgi:preprotein translocase subunit Sss1